MTDSPAIGIDLGTVYSSVGVWMDSVNKVEIIPNDQGNRITPSYVAFTEKERLIGDGAFNQITDNPANTIFGAKRFIGRRFDDSGVQNDIKHWPFKVEAGLDRKPVVSVKFRGETKKFSAEEISAMILTRMKEIAEVYLNKPVKDAVITVPASFNDAQRQATRDAAKIAGLNALRILNEPTAAALAYGIGGKGQGKKKVLIFDLGGGTFDVSLLAIDEGLFEVKATTGDTHLGGVDFTSKLVEFCVAEFQHKKGLDIRNNPRAMRRMRAHCEKAKRILSSSTHTTIEIDSLMNSEDFICDLTRSKFEELCLPLFKKTIPLLEQVLKDGGVTKNQINDIVLVGGSTRIPKVVQLITEFFDGREPNCSFNPEEAVACGAAIKAAIISGQISKQVPGLLVQDITPSSKGIETADEALLIIIPRNSAIPIKKKHLFTTYLDNQTAVDIKIYEGEQPVAKDNHLLGTLRLEGIPPAPRGNAKIEVIFEIDSCGILNVSAVDKESGVKQQITIVSETNRLTQEKVQEMIKEAEKLKMDDELLRNRAEARAKLESYCHSVHNALQDTKFQGKFTEDEKKQLETTSSEILLWIEAHPEVEGLDYLRKLKEIESMYNLIDFRTKQQEQREATINRQYPEGPVTKYTNVYPTEEELRALKEKEEREAALNKEGPNARYMDVNLEEEQIKPLPQQEAAGP